MSEDKQERKAKWDQPEIEDFTDEYSESGDQSRQKWWGHHHGGCRPMVAGGWPCRPNSACYPAGAWACNPHRPCYPRVGFQLFNPYCRPNGFNYGYGCYPRR